MHKSESVEELSMGTVAGDVNCQIIPSNFRRLNPKRYGGTSVNTYQTTRPHISEGRRLEPQVCLCFKVSSRPVQLKVTISTPRTKGILIT
jgi:hypothetical protein